MRVPHSTMHDPIYDALGHLFTALGICGSARDPIPSELIGWLVLSTPNRNQMPKHVEITQIYMQKRGIHGLNPYVNYV
jgi:hypothetical protein